MTLRLTNPKAKICAMCRHWNGQVGGLTVKPRKNSPNFFEHDPEEAQTCYKNHFVKKAWNSCSEWTGRY